MEFTQQVQVRHQILRYVRRSAALLFVASLLLPSGIINGGPPSDFATNLGIAAWIGSLMLWQTMDFASVDWHIPATHWFAWAIPLAGIINFVLIYYLIIWDQPFKWRRLIVVCFGISLQIIIQVDPRSGNIYFGIGYIFWILSYIAVATGMLMRRWFTHLNTMGAAHSTSLTPVAEKV
jgi:hypothetical protein